MLDHGLTHTASKITRDINADLQNLGSHMEAIDLKLDVTVSQANQNTDHFQDLQEQLEIAPAKTDDLKNKLRRCNPE